MPALFFLTIYGSFCGNYIFKYAVYPLESGLIDFTKMISHRISLDEIQTGIDAMKEGETLEVVVYPNL